MATHIWELTDIPIPINGFSVSVAENVTYMFYLMERHDLPYNNRGSILWIIWSIWKNRNSIIYAGKQDSLHRLIQTAYDDSKYWREINDAPVIR